MKTTIDKIYIEKTGLFLGLFLFFYIIIFQPIENITTNNMAACSLLMAIWWMTEALPLAATSLVPMILFPLLGILSAKETADQFINSTIFLFLGGFLLALAVEQWDLHKRISLNIIKLLGKSPARMIFGFMVSSWLMSMLITNTATTIMMLPIGLAVIREMESEFGTKKTKTLSTALLLGIAYAATVGGIATLVGTVPNMVFVRIFENTFPLAPDISFGKWFMFGFPLSAASLAILYFIIVKFLFKPDKGIKINRNLISNQLKELGKMAYEEKAVLIIMASTAFLWIFRKDISLGSFTIPGWSSALPFGHLIDDATVAISASIALFLIPVKNKSSAQKRLLNHGIFKRVPWDIVLIFGGGFALAEGFQSSGLSVLIGEQFSSLSGIHPIIFTFLICFLIIFLSEVTSNTATTNTFLPILASMAVAIGINPMLLMVPATIAASYAFMLPVATPPNAIIFSSEKVKISEMIKAGFVLNIIAVVVITTMFYLFGQFIYGIDIGVMPGWATP